MNDPKNWSLNVRLRGDELALLLEALTSCEESRQPGFDADEAHELLRKLTHKWECNA